MIPTERINIVLLFFCVGFQSCVSYHNLQTEKLDQYYAASIVDASYPEAGEVYNGLISIEPDNEKLIWKEIDGKNYMLVATWAAEAHYYPDQGAYNTSNYPIWVTAAPQLLNWYQSRKPKELQNKDLRLKQLLGLPPTVKKNYFIEFWVQPEDLFRPCPDKEVTDSSCGLCFSDELDEEHKTWIRNLRNDSYYNCNGDKYPWTQLGYTYDWYPGNKSHVGLSEFVIKAQSDIIVNKKYTTAEYLSQ